MKKILMTVAAMAAACTFGGVFDDCVYLFEGGLDANGNGLFSTGELYGGDLYHADGRGVELAAMVLFNTIYGEFIEEKTTYADVLAAGATELSESEWNRLARYAHTVFIHGCTVIFR